MGRALDVRDLRAKAQGAESPRDKALAYLEAGERAASHGHPAIAAAYFLRAMRSDPDNTDVITRMATALRPRRPRLLEQLLWRKLAAAAETGGSPRMVASVLAALSQLYRLELRDRSRARALEAMAVRYRTVVE